MEQVIDIGSLIQDDRNLNLGTERGRKMVRRSFDAYGAGRSILIDKDNRIIAGNKSTQAALESGIRHVRVIESTGEELIAVKRVDISLESKEGRELAYSDNVTTQYDLLWDEGEIQRMANELDWTFVKDIGKGFPEWLPDALSFEEHQKSAWCDATDYGEALCDLNERVALHRREDRFYVSSFKTSKKGIPFSMIKTDQYVELFAAKAQEAISGIMGLRSTKGWCIVTTPKRRHKEENFATKVCAELSKKMGVPFYEDIMVCKNTKRVNPVFNLARHVEEENVILYDDIFTTGQTWRGSLELLNDKNVITIIGIDNG